MSTTNKYPDRLFQVQYNNYPQSWMNENGITAIHAQFIVDYKDGYDGFCIDEDNNRFYRIDGAKVIVFLDKKKIQNADRDSVIRDIRTTRFPGLSWDADYIERIHSFNDSHDNPLTMDKMRENGYFSVSETESQEWNTCNINNISFVCV